MLYLLPLALGWQRQISVVSLHQSHVGLRTQTLMIYIDTKRNDTTCLGCDSPQYDQYRYFNKLYQEMQTGFAQMEDYTSLSHR